MKITVSISDALSLELQQLATKAQTSDEELVERAIRYFLHVHRGAGVPRFARRLGPIAIADTTLLPGATEGRL